MQLIDTHVHLNFDVFQGHLQELQHRWQTAGVTQLIHSCVAPEEFPSLQSVADQCPEVSLAVGLHPLDAHLWHDQTAQQIQTYARQDCRIVALGEMGLDLHKADNHQQQEWVLLAQLQLAKELDLPVIIHCRDAAPALHQLLTDFWATHGPVRGVMHCWGGTTEEMSWFLDLGFYISFSGIVTFKNAQTVQECARQVRGDRLLVETDCPFLAPVPWRGKTNEPAYVRQVAEFVAQLRDVDLETLAQQTTANARELFGLPVVGGVTGRWGDGVTG